MTTKQLIRQNAEMARSITNGYLSDLSNADLFVRPVPAMNHIAWQLGHLIASEHRAMTGIGHTMPALPPGFEDRYTKDTAKIDDPSKFENKDQLLALADKIREGMFAALEKTPESTFEKPGPEEMRDYAPTIGAVLMLPGQHELMHVGQFVAVRRKLGKPVLF